MGPQVDFLRRALPLLFVTNGGQNSFMEALSIGTPLVVCPGFGDQVTNASKAETLDVGIKVDRPMMKKDTSDHEEDASKICEEYKQEISHALKKIISNNNYKAKAKMVCKEINKAGGVDAAIEILL